jgi:uncharacterized protein
VGAAEEVAAFCTKYDMLITMSSRGRKPMNKRPMNKKHHETLSRLIDIEYRELPLSPGRVLLFFPRDLTVIESDEGPGIVLKALREKGCREGMLPEVEGYSADYVEALVENFSELKRQGLIARELPEPLIEGLPLSRVIAANTMRCNMACTYCYNRFESNRARSSSDMSDRTLERLITFMKAHRQGKSPQSILFIGGETLMNMDLIRKAIPYRDEYLGEGSDLFLSVTTNGTLLTEEIIDFCSDCGITIKLTLDGDEKLHDRCRVFPDGKGSYKVIAARLPLLLFRHRNPAKYVTTTIDTIADGPQELILRFAAMGFNQVQLTEKYHEGGRVMEEHSHHNDDYRAIYRDMADFLYHRIRSRLYFFIIPLSEVLQKLAGRVPSFFPCDAGSGALGVGTDGSLYPCHHFFGNRDFQVGNVDDGMVSMKDLEPYRVPVTRRDTCAACWARFLCGGPCYHRSFAELGDPWRCIEWECERKRVLYEEMIVLYHRLKQDDSAALSWYLAECMRY